MKQLLFKNVVVGGFLTASVTREQLAEIMVIDCLSARRDRKKWIPKLVFSSNGQGIALAGSDPFFNMVMKEADITHADGMSVVFASKFASFALPERVATTDFFHNAVNAAIKKELSFYFLGGSEEQNSKVVTVIQERYPELQIAGRYHGYFGSEDDERVCADICSSGADVLWVGLGKPRQEYWSFKNRDYLGGVGWIKTCGGLYSYLTNDAPRAPEWMQNSGLEWFFRLINEPRRLGFRYLKTNPCALYRLLKFTK